MSNKDKQSNCFDTSQQVAKTKFRSLDLNSRNSQKLLTALLETGSMVCVSFFTFSIDTSECCVFRRQLVQIFFFSCFQPFFFLKWTKKCQIWGNISGSQPAFACQPALKSSLRQISDGNSLKNVLKDEKRLKTAAKKYFDQLSNAHSTWQLVEKHNFCAIVLGQL